MKSSLTLLVCALLTFLASGASAAEKTDSLRIEPGQKKLPLPGKSFRLNGHDAFIILPQKDRARGERIPWIWYAPTLPGLPAQSEVWMFRKFLAAGIAIAGIDIGESYGSPAGRKTYSLLYQHLTEKRHFSAKPCLLARSRGGLMLYNWAVENPDKLSGITGIYPVCNLESYPGLARAAKAYQLTPDELQKELSKHNPIARLAPLAKARIPIFHLQGDSDRVVPHAANTEILARRYRKLGGPVTVKMVEGGGHTMWPGWFQSDPLTTFAIAKALGR